MGFPILARWLYIESGPWWHKEPGHQQEWHWSCSTEYCGFNTKRIEFPFLPWDFSHLKLSQTHLQYKNILYSKHELNTLRPRQNGRHFPDDIFKWIFLNENARISINISLKFVPSGPISNIPTLVQVMAWCRPGDKPLSEPMMVRLPTHICATWPQWVKVVLTAT